VYAIVCGETDIIGRNKFGDLALGHNSADKSPRINTLAANDKHVENKSIYKKEWTTDLINSKPDKFLIGHDPEYQSR
jgi:hypothetical protein